MKNLVEKIKTYNYKQFFLNHGEKVGMGVAGLVTLLCLAMTSWGGYARNPLEMETEARKVQDQLAANRWPADEKEKFLIASADTAIQGALTPLDLAQFEYQIPLSPKVKTYQLPADEVEVLPPVDLIARAIEFPVLEEQAPEAPAEEPVAETKPKPEKTKERKRSGGGGLAGAAGVGAQLEENSGDTGSSGMASMNSGAAVKSRGKRASVVTAVVERRAQLERLRKAHHLETLSQAEPLLNYADFKLQRKRAIPAKDPWSGQWEDVKIDSALDTLNKVVLEEADLVAAEFIEGVFTMSLPRRADGDWDPRYVVHPRIPTLDKQQREEEEAKNAAAAEALEGADEEAGRNRRGLLRGQRDAKRMRRDAANRLGDEGFSGAVNDFMGGGGMGAAMGAGMAGSMPGGKGGGRMPGGGAMPGGMGSMPGGMGGMGSMPPGGIPGGGGSGVAPRPDMGKLMSGAMGRGGAGGGMMPGGGAGMSMPGGGAGMSMPGGGGMSMPGMGSGMGTGMPVVGQISSSGADLVMFRFFDFDVEPNECYIYRVQMVVDNPSFNSDFVRQSSVAEGETRESDWSQPSIPAIAPPEVQYMVHRVSKPPTPQRAAELDVIQFNTDFGSIVEAPLPLKFGQYVGGEKEVEFPNLGAQTFAKDKVNFASQDLFLDALPGPKLDPAMLADLGLEGDQKTVMSLQSQLDQAVTVNRLGKLQPVDGGSTSDIDDARKRLRELNEKYADLKQQSSSSGSGNLLGGGEEEQDGKKKKGRNSLKSGGSGRSGFPGSGMGGMGGPMGGMGGGAGGFPSSGPGGGSFPSSGSGGGSRPGGRGDRNN
ncbi:MAG: hypothetical protein ACK5TO_21680 [Planctomycetaceae bacterium]